MHFHRPPPNKRTAYTTGHSPMIRDLEHQLNRVERDRVRQFMSEAVNCYYNGNYRAAITMSFNAATYDILQMLQDVARANTRSNDIQNKIHDLSDTYDEGEESWEETALNLADTAQVLTNEDLDSVRQVRQLRHKCAHPSDHEPSAEEARYCITTVIDSVLHNPSVKGHEEVKHFIAEIESAYVFAEDEDNEKTIRQRCDAMDEGALKFLVSELAAHLWSEDLKQNGRENAKTMFLGVLNHYQLCADYFWSDKIFGDLITRATTGELAIARSPKRDLLDLTARAATQFHRADDGIRARFTDFLVDQLFRNRARKVLRALIEADNVTERLQDRVTQKLQAANWGKRTRTRKAKKHAKLFTETKAEWYRESLQEKIENDLDGSFYAQNAAIIALEAAGEEFLQELSEEQFVRILVKICGAASLTLEKTAGDSYHAIDIIKDGPPEHWPVVDALGKTLDSGAIEPAQFAEKPATIANLARLLVANGETDLTKELLSLVAESSDDNATLNLEIAAPKMPEEVESHVESLIE